MASHMEKVAKLLGVEVGEAFEVYIGGECQGRCRFTKDRVEVLDNHCWYRTKAETLEWLLDGTATIIKLPWKPEVNEFYFSPAPDNKVLWNYQSWFGNEDDYYRLSHGLVFKTSKEAIEVSKKMLAVAKGCES